MATVIRSSRPQSQASSEGLDSQLSLSRGDLPTDDSEALLIEIGIRQRKPLTGTSNALEGLLWPLGHLLEGLFGSRPHSRCPGGSVLM